MVGSSHVGILTRGLPCPPSQPPYALHHSNSAQASLVGWVFNDTPLLRGQWESAYLTSTTCASYPYVTASYNVLYGALTLGGAIGDLVVNGLVAEANGFTGL